MALSNWDSLSVDQAGNPTSGVFTSPLGVSVEVYKNWLYVRDEKAWVAGAFSRPTVMEVQAGNIRYKDVHIHAVRGPRSGVYAAVHVSVYEKETDGCDKCKAARGKYHASDCVDRVPTHVLGMVGCGVYGYDGEEFVGVTEDCVEFLRDWLTNDDVDHPPEFRRINFGGATRHNQGDAFFASHFGEPVPATAPGAAEPTIMSQLFHKD
jgi:hypothetical protein